MIGLVDTALILEHRAVAEAVRLRYVTDSAAGIARVRRGKAFSYVNARKQPVRDLETLERINRLRIPPAWQDVWICPTADGHLQATGRDARGRKQYRYHNRWTESRDMLKYERMIDFGQALPRIRRRIAHDLKQPGLPKAKVLATVLRIMQLTLIRVGNEEYARSNGSYGLTTMQDEHVGVSGSRIRFQFRGKSGMRHEIDVDDARLAKIVKRCQDLPGQELFQYRDENNKVCDINSHDVNEYLRAVTTHEFSVKDFRTWAGTTLAVRQLKNCEQCLSQTRAKRNIVQVLDCVAKQLGNTRAVCRKSYVHPGVLDAYLEGTLHGRIGRAPRISGLASHEAEVMGLLQNLVQDTSPSIKPVGKKQTKAKASAGGGKPGKVASVVRGKQKPR